MRQLSEHQFDLHFADGMLAGLKLIGLGIWERRSFALLRPIGVLCVWRGDGGSRGGVVDQGRPLSLLAVEP